MLGLWHCMVVVVRLGTIKNLGMWSFVRLCGYLLLACFGLKFYRKSPLLQSHRDSAKKEGKPWPFKGGIVFLDG